ncbi:kinase binding protein CGI-121-domain-containing protein [Blastocladiella britannica]|nr:kinase binding protein CGI-121-domain-containing protein [Blastocladiella britannica]
MAILEIAHAAPTLPPVPSSATSSSTTAPPPPTQSPILARVDVELWCEVTNAASLRSQAIAAGTATTTTDADEPAARSPLRDILFLDADMIASPLHLRAALTRALAAREAGTMRTRTIGTEVTAALSPASTNVAVALTHFGISDACSNVLAIRVLSAAQDNDQEEEDVDDLDLARYIHGTRTSLDRLGYSCDVPRLLAAMGLSSNGATRDFAGMSMRELELVLVEAIALKGILT